MYLRIKNLKKFTPKSFIDMNIGQPLFKIQSRPMYYYGNGIIISYSNICFKIENFERIEYGGQGEFAVSIYHFAEKEFLKRYLKLYDFEADDISALDVNIVDDKINYQSTFKSVHDWYVKEHPAIYYKEGETRTRVDGNMVIQNLFITCGAYTLLFSGRTKNTKLSGFQCTLT